MKFILSILLSVIASALSSQTIVVSEPTLLKNYALTKITERNKELLILENRNQLKFILLDQQTLVDHYKLKYRLSVKLNDTIVTMEWDTEKNTIRHPKLPDAGIFRQMADNKAVIKKSRMTDEGKRTIMERKFKVFKWNEQSIVLQDITDPDINRVYTFKAVE